MGPTHPAPLLFRITCVAKNPRLNPVGRPPASDSADTRKRIIHAAREVFRSVGYAGATHMAIAASADLTRPAVNYHFTGKRALFDFVVEANVDIVDAALAEAAGETTLRGRLRAFTTAVCVDAEVHAATAFLASAALEYRRHPELQRGGDEVCTSLREFLKTSVASAVEHHELRSDVEASSVVDTLYAVLIGMALYAGDIVDDHRSQARIDSMMLLLTGDLFKDPAQRLTKTATRVA